MTIQEAIAAYKAAQDALWALAEECAKVGDDEGFIHYTAEAFFMPHPVWAALKTAKSFSGGGEMRKPFRVPSQAGYQ